MNDAMETITRGLRSDVTDLERKVDDHIAKFNRQSVSLQYALELRSQLSQQRHDISELSNRVNDHIAHCENDTSDLNEYFKRTISDLLQAQKELAEKLELHISTTERALMNLDKNMSNLDRNMSICLNYTQALLQKHMTDSQIEELNRTHGLESDEPKKT